MCLSGLFATSANLTISMKRPIRLYTLLLFLAITSAYTVKAGHASLMELEYRHVSGTTYEFTLTFYRNCLGSSAAAPAVYIIGAKSDALSLLVSNFATLTQVPLGSAPPLSNLHNCSTRPLCYEEYVYRGTASVPYITDDLIFWASLCCYPTEIDNLPANSIYTECGMNTLDFPHGNDSPFWHSRVPNRIGHNSFSDIVINYPVKSVCANKEVTVFQNVEEFQGDQVKYEFIEPLGSGGIPAGWAAGYSFTNPFPFYSPPGFEIDTNTGEIVFRADSMPTPKPGTDMYVVGIKATEYRLAAGVLKEIGHVVRHYTIIVEPAASCPGSGIALKDQLAVMQCGDTSIAVEVTKKFLCSSADADASFVELTDSITGSSVAINGVSVDNCWYGMVSTDFEVNLSASLASGTYYLTLVNGMDGNTIESECGFFILPRQDTLTIRVPDLPEVVVLPSTDTNGAPLTYIAAECGQQTIDVQLDASVWCSSIDTMASEWALMDSSGVTPVAVPIQKVSYDCQNDQTQLLTFHFSAPLEAGTYSLALQVGTDGNTLLNTCDKESKPSTVSLVVSDVYVTLGADLEYCKDSLFFAFLDAGSDWSSYNWSTGDTTQQLLVTTKGVYTIEVGNAFGCIATDSVVVVEKICWTGIDEENTNGWVLFPNPSKGAIYIENTQFTKEVTIKVLDLRGKEVYKVTTSVEKGGRYALDLSNQPKGVYLVTVGEDKGEQLLSKKIVLE
jgi:hypothetical protein